MKQVFVIVEKYWNGTSYNEDVFAVYESEDAARKEAETRQGKMRKCDLEFYVVEVPFVEANI